MIICAAVKRGNEVVRGHRHHNCIRAAVEDLKREPPVYSLEMGFVNSEGKFVDRQEARKEFIECGQGVPQETNGLYSEDLY